MPGAVFESKLQFHPIPMKPTHLVALVLSAVLLSTGCNKKSNDAAVAEKLAELERKANEAVAYQQELEQQLADQKLAAERDAIERERMEIEDARAALEQQQGDAAAADAEKLRQREEELAKREGKVEQLQSSLDDRAADLQQRGEELSDRDRELAGREALVTENNEVPVAPVGDYGTFYESLSPYGHWFETPVYGYVWQPVIVRDSRWHPYTRGRWACSDHGWTWMSDEPFGWATYHYGRWSVLRGYGWVWVPGSEWAPAWVSWRSGGNHIGWAPLPPETLAYRGHHWDSTVDATFGTSASWYNFVETRHFGSPVWHHCMPYQDNNIYLQQTVNITNIHVRNNRVICGGPRYNDVTHALGRAMPFYHLDLDHHSRPGRDPHSMTPEVRGDRLRMAAPNMDVAWNEGLKPAHVKGRLDDVTVERSAPPRPDVIDQFHKNRAEKQQQAELAITGMGGQDNLNQRRRQEFETNRRQIEANARLTESARDQGKARQTNDRGRPMDAGLDAARRAQTEKIQMDSARRDQSNQKLADAQRTQNERLQADAARRAQAEKLQLDSARREQANRQLSDAQRAQNERLQADAARRAQVENIQLDAARREQAKQKPGEAQRTQNERLQADAARRAQAEKLQLDAARREQAALQASKQQELARQQQAARQQQQEAARQQQQEAAHQQQQEAARQQQQERARQQREFTRQQQQEAARQQQQETARQQREFARQQQQEAARQQQQERGRQQQEERGRQQQQDRGKQQDDDDRKRGFGR